MNRQLFAGLVCAGALAPLAGAQKLQVIYSKIPAHPTAVIPGTLDLAGMPAATTWRAIEDIAVKADGSDWVVKGRTQLGSDLETILVRGSGATGTMFCQEGQPFQGAAAGELYDFFDTPDPVSYDTTGSLAFSARARGGVTSDDEKLIIVDPASVHMQILTQGSPALGLIDVPANPTGDELIGNSIGSVHLRNGGTVGFVNTPITNCSSLRYPAFFLNATSFRQSGVSVIAGETWDSFVLDGAGGTPDGAHWFAEGDTENTNTAIDGIFVVDDVVVLREGSPIPGSALLFGDAFQAKMAPNGSYIVRGRDNSGTTAAAPDFVLMNGTKLLQTGESVEGGAELWGDTIAAVAVNSLNDWIVVGKTNNASTALDEVLVYNGRVYLREGDPVDVDGNGLFDDDAFIGRGTNTLTAFDANDWIITDDGWIYGIVNLRNGAGADLNGAGFGTPGAFVRMQVRKAPEAFCFGDGSGTACPCGNSGAAGNGCAHSISAAGANLAATGSSSISNDTLALLGTNMPNSSALYFQGTTRIAGGAGTTFGDGLRCAGGSIIRLGTKINSGGASQYPVGADLSISVRGLNVPATLRTYQIWYRNAASFCTPDTFNLSNAVEVLWES